MSLRFVSKYYANRNPINLNNLSPLKSYLGFRWFSNCKPLSDMWLIGHLRGSYYGTGKYTRINFMETSHPKNNPLATRPIFNSTVIKKKSHSNSQAVYKDLDAAKLLRNIEGNKTTPQGTIKISSEKSVLAEQVERIASKKKENKEKYEKMKYWFTLISSINFTILFTFVGNLIYCWYNPVHRVKASKYNPYFGKILDQILDPVDDDFKRQAEMEEAENPLFPVYLKQNIISFKEAVQKKVSSGDDKDTTKSQNEK